MEFITKDDVWGIRKLVEDIFRKERGWRKDTDRYDKRIYEFEFNVFYNQYVPPTWRESRRTVLRHMKEIKELIPKMYFTRNFNSTPVFQVWIKKEVVEIRGWRSAKAKQSVKCCGLTPDLYERIKNKKVNLPTYLEIEEEKTRWQEKPDYKKEEGLSQPLKEEFIQLRLHRE